MSNFRLAYASGDQPPTALAGGDLLAVIEYHHPHLSDESYAVFGGKIINYLGDFPKPDIETGNTEVTTTPYSAMEARWLGRNQQLYEEALLTIDQLTEGLVTRTQEEYLASGAE